jgi:hypothetical protein
MTRPGRTRIRGGRASVRFRSTRERSLWLLVVAVMAATMCALAQQLGWSVVPRTALAAIAAVVTLLVPELRRRGARSDRAAQLLGRVEIPTRRDALPLVSDLRPQELRVHESFLTVPYVPRDVEDTWTPPCAHGSRCSWSVTRWQARRVLLRSG